MTSRIAHKCSIWYTVLVCLVSCRYWITSCQTTHSIFTGTAQHAQSIQQMNTRHVLQPSFANYLQSSDTHGRTHKTYLTLYPHLNVNVFGYTHGRCPDFIYSDSLFSTVHTAPGSNETVNKALPRERKLTQMTSFIVTPLSLYYIVHTADVLYCFWFTSTNSTGCYTEGSPIKAF